MTNKQITQANPETIAKAAEIKGLAFERALNELAITVRATGLSEREILEIWIDEG